MQASSLFWRLTQLSLVAGSLTLAACNKGQPPAPSSVAVEVYVVQSSAHAIQTELPGRTSAYQIAEIRPQVTGLINKRLFQEGAYIREGQSLYQIDPEIYQANYTAAKANLAKAQASLNANRLLAERYRELVTTDAISKQEHDNAQAAYQQSQADVYAAQASLNIAQINLKYSRVPAPISGKIGKSSVTQGALVTANQAQALSTIQQIDPIYVDMTQSSADILELQRQLKSGSLQRASDALNVELIMDNGEVYPIKGNLQFQDISVDPGTASVTLRAVFANPQNEILPGMFVKARLQLANNPNAKLVPQQGITRTPQGDAVAMVVDAKNLAQARPVKVAGMSNGYFIVTEGLKDGEKVITNGLMMLRPGTPVTITSPKPSAAKTPSPTAK